MTLEKIGSRLRKYLKHKEIGVNKFGSLTKTSGAQISNILNGKNYGITKLINIVEYCKDLNIVWLLKGEGDMILDPTASNYYQLQLSGNGVKAAAILEENEKLKEEIEKLNVKISQVEAMGACKDLTIDALRTSVDVLNSSNKDLKELLGIYKSDFNQESRKETA